MVVCLSINPWESVPGEFQDWRGISGSLMLRYDNFNMYIYVVVTKRAAVGAFKEIITYCCHTVIL